MRRYNLDAYRQYMDLVQKIHMKFPKDNILMTCYDTCYLFLGDEYYASGSLYEQMAEPTLHMLMKALGSRHAFMEREIPDADRLYHTYSLVYEGFLKATDDDLDACIHVVTNVISWWVQNIRYPSILELYKFHIQDVLPDKYKDDTLENRKEMAVKLGLFKLGDSLKKPNQIIEMPVRLCVNED